MSKKMDLTGQRFGRLVVIKDTGERQNGSIIWQCNCDCGNIKNVNSKNLIHAGTQSCGCLQVEKATKANYKEIKGQKFGSLTAMQFIRKKGSNTYWEFECECGNKVIVQKTSVMSGLTRSCGCLQREVAKQYIVEANKGINWVESTDLLKLNNTPQSNNATSGVKGVDFDKSRGKWRSNITFQGKHIYLGRFNTLEEAAQVRKKAEEKYFHPILEKYGRLNDD